ncbi:MAG: hypothetical protein ACK41G_09275 [Candidatus Thermochlorobacter sp.]
MNSTTPIYDKVADRLALHLGELSEISYSALQLLPFPALFKNLFFVELRREAREELRRFKSEKFLFGHSSLEALRNALADNAAKLSVLTREDCLKLLRRTSRLTAEYLVRPQHFLGKYLYAESYELKAEALSAMLEPFVEYAYLSEVLRQYLAKKQIETLPEERFEKLISEIDKKVCATFSPAEWAHLLEPLCDFYFLGGETKVPISELQLFLREKDALAALSMLTQLREHGIDAIAKDDMIWLFEGDIAPLLRKRKTIKVSPEFEETLMSHLSRNLLDETLLNAIQIDDTETQNVSESTPQTLADATLPKPDASLPSEPLLKETAKVNPPAVPADPTAKEVALPAPPAKDMTPPPIAAKAESAPAPAEFAELPNKVMAAADNAKRQSPPSLQQEQHQPVTQTNSQIEPAKPMSSHIQVPPESSSESRKDIPKESAKVIHRAQGALLPVKVMPPPSTKSELKDLRTMITLSDRKKIIKRVFKGSEENYERAIAALNQKQTWREASLYLDQEVFRRYNVDEYSMEAVKLTDTVFDRHFNKTLNTSQP